MTYLADKSVLVTGGTGSFGKAFIRRLLSDFEPRRVVVFSRDELKQYEFRQALGDDPRLRWFIGDVRDPQRLARAFSGVDVVIHADAVKAEVGQAKTVGRDIDVTDRDGAKRARHKDFGVGRTGEFVEVHRRAEAQAILGFARCLDVDVDFIVQECVAGAGGAQTSICAAAQGHISCRNARRGHQSSSSEDTASQFQPIRRFIPQNITVFFKRFTDSSFVVLSVHAWESAVGDGAICPSFRFRGQFKARGVFFRPFLGGR